jgi:glycosyltransferase involved in cell wall biosynthesis
MYNPRTLVSVILPTYNRVDYLPFAIESVLNQTHANLELHIIDDGSTDATSELVSAYKDDRIFYRYQKNQGQSVARAAGLNNARGAYICFLDSDDLMKPGKLERQIQLMEENPDYHVIYGENEIIDETGRVQAQARTIRRHSGNIMKELLAFNFIEFETAMIRRLCFDEMGGPNINTRVADDYEMFLKFSTRYKFLYVPEIFAQYRVMASQISSNKDQRFQSNHTILSNFFKLYPELVDTDTIDYTWCRFYTNRGRYQASVGKLKPAFLDYLTAIRYKPFSKHPWRALLKLILLRR